MFGAIGCKLAFTAGFCDPGPWLPVGSSAFLDWLRVGGTSPFSQGFLDLPVPWVRESGVGWGGSSWPKEGLRYRWWYLLGESPPRVPNPDGSPLLTDSLRSCLPVPAQGGSSEPLWSWKCPQVTPCPEYSLLYGFQLAKQTKIKILLFSFETSKFKKEKRRRKILGLQMKASVFTTTLLSP